jgi:acyl-CoA synthetase (AMP-forming)/AMP-acid ligase II
LLLFIGSYDRELISRFKRTQIFTVEDFDLLVDIVASCGGLVTTPHILAEVSNLSGQLEDDRRSRYFAVFAKLVNQLGERSVPASTAVAHPIFRRLGLTDAAVATLVQGEPIAVLTVDFDLWAHLSAAGVAAYNFNHVRVSGWL